MQPVQHGVHKLENVTNSEPSMRNASECIDDQQTTKKSFSRHHHQLQQQQQLFIARPASCTAKPSHFL